MSESNGAGRHRHDLLQTILKGHFASDDADLIASIKASAEFIDLPSGAILFHHGRAFLDGADQPESREQGCGSLFDSLGAELERKTA